jgi:hypothetical protein
MTLWSKLVTRLPSSQHRALDYVVNVLRIDDVANLLTQVCAGGEEVVFEAN